MAQLQRGMAQELLLLAWQAGPGRHIKQAFLRYGGNTEINVLHVQ